MLTNIIIANLTVGVIGVLGVWLLLKSKLFSDDKLHYLISLAAGVMLGVAVLDLLPHAVREGGEGVFSFFLLGILIFFLLERFLFWHHHHDGHGIKPTATLVLLGDGLHNFLDGIVIASAFSVSIEVGLIATIAVILHEIPQEIADFSVLINSGLSKKKSILYNFISALTAVVGGIVGWQLMEKIAWFHGLIGAIAGGMFLYIACADLIPELHHEKLGMKKTLMQVGVMLFGVGVVYMISMSGVGD